jgi:hypothetical protein
MNVDDTVMIIILKVFNTSKFSIDVFEAVRLTNAPSMLVLCRQSKP